MNTGLLYCLSFEMMRILTSLCIGLHDAPQHNNCYHGNLGEIILLQYYFFYCISTVFIFTVKRHKNHQSYEFTKISTKYVLECKELRFCLAIMCNVTGNSFILADCNPTHVHFSMDDLVPLNLQ